MTLARALIVDDSLIMRGLFSGILERTRGIEVVGVAANADEAREMMIALQPSVVTLDVEMPGMGGLEFLEEIMRDRPTPVVMLSSLTRKGAAESFRALELGAVDCFCKPRHADADEFKALGAKLSALVLAASSAGVRRVPRKRAKTAPGFFHWNGKIIAMTGSVGAVEALIEIMPQLPANCPPTVVLLQIDPDFVAPLLERLLSESKVRIIRAEHEQLLEQGTVYLVTDSWLHAVVDQSPLPRLRLLDSPPINGIRPSADFLLATTAKTIGADAVGVMLSGLGADGAKGLKLMRAAGARTLCQDAASSLVHEAVAAARAESANEAELPLDEIVPWLLAACSALPGQSIHEAH